MGSEDKQQPTGPLEGKPNQRSSTPTYDALLQAFSNADLLSWAGFGLGIGVVLGAIFLRPAEWAYNRGIAWWLEPAASAFYNRILAPIGRGIAQGCSWIYENIFKPLKISNILKFIGNTLILPLDGFIISPFDILLFGKVRSKTERKNPEMELNLPLTTRLFNFGAWGATLGAGSYAGALVGAAMGAAVGGPPGAVIGLIIGIAYGGPILNKIVNATRDYFAERRARREPPTISVVEIITLEEEGSDHASQQLRGSSLVTINRRLGTSPQPSSSLVQSNHNSQLAKQGVKIHRSDGSEQPVVQLDNLKMRSKSR